MGIRSSSGVVPWVRPCRDFPFFLAFGPGETAFTWTILPVAAIAFTGVLLASWAWIVYFWYTVVSALFGIPSVSWAVLPNAIFAGGAACAFWRWYIRSLVVI